MGSFADACLMKDTNEVSKPSPKILVDSENVLIETLVRYENDNASPAKILDTNNTKRSRQHRMAQHNNAFIFDDVELMRPLEFT